MAHHESCRQVNADREQGTPLFLTAMASEGTSTQREETTVSETIPKSLDAPRAHSDAEEASFQVQGQVVLILCGLIASGKVCAFLQVLNIPRSALLLS